MAALVFFDHSRRILVLVNKKIGKSDLIGSSVAAQPIFWQLPSAYSAPANAHNKRTLI